MTSPPPPAGQSGAEAPVAKKIRHCRFGSLVMKSLQHEEWKTELSIMGFKNV